MIIVKNFNLINHAGTVLRLRLIVRLHHLTVQALHNIQHRRLRIHQVLHQGLPITSIRPHRPRLLSVPRIRLQVQCIPLQMLHTLRPLYTIHRMLEVHNTINHIVQVLPFTRLLIFL